METVLSSKRNHYMARVGVFLIMVALIAGMAGCGEVAPPTTQYELTIAIAPDGGGTATDLTNASPYPAGTTVSIKAEASAGYQFVGWTATGGTFTDATAAQTTFTMPGEDVTVTANFAQAATYSLTMAVAPGGSGTATDLTNASPYPAGTAVSIKAVANQGYQFVGWAATGGTFADASAAETTYSMPAQNTTITANFFQGQLIRTWSDLDAIRNNLSGSYLLMNNLDSATAGYTELAGPTANGGKGWQPIGDGYVCNFTGTFDGHGYEIKGLFINRPDEWGVGLFGEVGPGGVIKGTGLADTNVTGTEQVGGLAGVCFHNSTVSDSHSSGAVIGVWFVGGLIGTLSRWCTLAYSYSSGSVTGSAGVGGLVGESLGNVSNSYSTCRVVSVPDIGGRAQGATGGLEGINWYGTVSNSYSSGDVTGVSWVGGLVAANDHATVSNSYSSGDVTGVSWVGGLVAANDHATVSNSYSTGRVIGSEQVGGLVADSTNNGTVSNSFWDTETSGQAGSAGGTGKTTAEMKTIDTFQVAGWSITYVADADKRNPDAYWNIVPDQTYPFLSWQPVF